MENDHGLSVMDLSFICELVHKEAAIFLDDAKTYLIVARLEPLAKRESFSTLSELVDNLRRPGNASLTAKVVDAMTTNETSFFRDIHPFVGLRKYVIPEIMERKEETREINIWCAAASSGQEPYTLSLVMKEYFPELSDWKVSILATDISETMLKRCREGLFSKLEVNRGLPAQMLIKYFEQVDADWRIKDEVRSMIDFRLMNLIDTWPVMAKMDVVFIRNVLIYFDLETKKAILEKVRRTMDPEGYMFLGGAETTLNIDAAFHRFRLDKTTCYTLKEKMAAGVVAHA